MAFTVDDFRRVIEQLRPVEPKTLTDPKATTIAFATHILQKLMEWSIYIFLVALLFSGLIYLFALGNETQSQAAKKSLIYSFVGFLVVVSAYGILTFVLGQIGFIESTTTVSQVAAQIFKFAFVAAGVGFLFILLFAGTRYMFSLGNEDQATLARKQIIDALIGLALVLAAYSIGRAIIVLVKFAT